MQPSGNQHLNSRPTSVGLRPYVGLRPHLGLRPYVGLRPHLGLRPYIGLRALIGLRAPISVCLLYTLFLGFVPPAWSQPDSGQPLPLKDNTERQLKEGQSAPQSSDNNANESRESTENNATNNAEGRGNANDTGSILDQNSQNDANDPGARFLPAAAEFRNYITPRLQRAMVDRHIPGAVLVVIHDGELYYLEGAGFSDLAARRSVDVNRTSFRVGRISALFTSALVLHARDQRLWDLPDAARQYSGTVQVPGHAQRRNAAGQAAALSIRDLLYRETGLNALTTAPLVPTPADRRSLAYYLSREQPLPETGEIDVIRPSDYEITLLGHLLEQRSGMPFPEYARTRLFHPQSMRYSEFLPEELPAYIRARSYTFEDSEYRLNADTYFPEVPAQSLSISGKDMATFMQILFRGGANQGVRFLTPESAGAILRQDGWRYRHRTVRYGLIATRQRNRLVLYRSADIPGYSAYLALLPESRTGFFIAANSHAPEFTRDIFRFIVTPYF